MPLCNSTVFFVRLLCLNEFWNCVFVATCWSALTVVSSTAVVSSGTATRSQTSSPSARRPDMCGPV